jgi:hypothetical protein
MTDDFPSEERRWLARQLVRILSILATGFLVLRVFVHGHAPPATLAGWNGLLCFAPMAIGQIAYWALLRPARR